MSEIFHKGVNWCGRLTLGCRTTVASVIEHYSYFGTAITDKKRHHAMSPCPRRGTVAERGVRRKFVSQYGVIVGISSSSEYKKGVRQHFGVCAADPQELTVIRSLAFATSAVVCLFICLSVCLRATETRSAPPYEPPCLGNVFAFICYCSLTVSDDRVMSQHVYCSSFSVSPCGLSVFDVSPCSNVDLIKTFQHVTSRFYI